MKEARTIWREDQYQALDAEPGLFFFGREKGDFFHVYSRSDTGRRKLLQTVNLEQDWFWDPETKKLVAEEVAEASETKREEHVLAGYSWKTSRQSISPAWIEDLSAQVSVDPIELETGAQLIVLRPKKINHWFVSLHGGPESNEQFEIRYQGLYRQLLRKNVAVVIFNYTGSNDLKPGVSEKAWGRWEDSIQEDSRALANSLKPMGFTWNNSTLFGASFGGALALLMAKHFAAKMVLLSSPLLDLRQQKARAGDDFLTWFSSRFSAADEQAISAEAFQAVAVPVYCAWSIGDEVLGKDVFESASLLLKRWRFEAFDSAHSSQGYLQQRKRFQKIFDQVVS